MMEFELPSRTLASSDGIDELELHRRYLKGLGIVAGLLLEGAGERDWAEVLRILAETTGIDICAVFLDDPGQEGRARTHLRSTWSRAGSASQLSDFEGLRHLNYADCPVLSDTLQVGMVWCRDLDEMPAAEAHLFGSQNIHSTLCIPLLVGGEMEGFLGFFTRRAKRQWAPVEINVLCAIANSLALALRRHRAERSLAAGAARLRALVGATEDLVLEFDQAGHLLNIWTDNPVFGQLLESAGIGDSLECALPEEMANAIRHIMPRTTTGSPRETFEFNLPQEGGNRFFTGRLQAVPSETGQSGHLVALIRDITDAMDDAARRLSMLETLDLLEEAIVDLTPTGVLANVSAAWNKLLGSTYQPPGQHLGQPLAAYVHQDDRAPLDTVLRRLAHGEIHSEMTRFRLMQGGDQYIWVEARLLAHRAPQGYIAALRGILRDITSSYLQEKRITQLALHDALTQLPNRILFEDHLHQAIARAQRNDEKVGLGFIDLDHFKHINDTLGHSAGDTVLVTLSRRLQSVLREVDTLSRWGGDEFVVLLPDVRGEEEVRQIAERLRDVARESIDLDGVETKLTISIGFAIYPDDADDSETLMSVADHTMFHAKSVGRNNVQLFRDLQDKTPDRHNVLLQTRLSRTIQDRLIQVFYQPIVDVISGHILAFESLARWHDDQEGWVPPKVFIPMAEHLGLIHELGEQVVDHSLQRLRAWRTMNLPIRGTVNISRTQLFAPCFVQRLLEKVETYDLRPADLVLEITESVALLDFSYESRRLEELHSAGFPIAIDDFGTGYSALSQLHEMPVDILKIDRSFTSRLNTEEGRRIVQAIVQMAEALHLEMIVEGVEDGATAAYLRAIGVTQMQGFHFSEAVPAGVCQMMIQDGFLRRA